MAEPVQSLEDQPQGLTVGDTIILLGGRYNKLKGKLYNYRRDRFSILPYSTSNKLIHIPMVDTEEGPVPDPELGIQEIVQLESAVTPGFLALVGMEAGDIFEAFDAEGNPVARLTVLGTNPDADSATVQYENGEEKELEFAFQGLQENMGFEVLRKEDQKPPVEEAGLPSEVAPESTLGPVGTVALDATDVERDGQLPSREEQAEVVADSAPGVFEIEGDLEVEVEEEKEEIASEFKRDPDVIQRSELLSQLLRLLPQAQQRDPQSTQQQRRLRELLFLLRDKLIEYNPLGEPLAKKETSLLTLSKLVKKGPVPLARKVVQGQKRVVLNHRFVQLPTGSLLPDPSEPSAGETWEGHEEYVAAYTEDYVKTAHVLAEEMNKDTGQQIQGTLPKFYTQQDSFRLALQQPFEFRLGDQPLEQDEEVFREQAPDFETPPLEGFTTRHLDPDMFTVHTDIESTALPFEEVRLQSGRIGRFPRTAEIYRYVEAPDRPLYTNVLLFPLSSLRELGPIRSGSLAKDMSLAYSEIQTHEDLYKDLGEVSEFPTAEGILNIGIDGNLAGDTLLKDWLDQQALRLTGLGDVVEQLQAYAINDIEWNSDQQAVLQEKIMKTIAQLKNFLAKQREENKAMLANLKFEPQNLLLPEYAQRLAQRLESEPLLKKELGEFRNYMGDLSTIDVNWFTYLFDKFPDFVLAVLGKQETILARERIRHINERTLETLQIAARMDHLEKTAGQPTLPRKCPHFEKLELVRKGIQQKGEEPNDRTKMKLLLKLLSVYRGKTEDNWIWCEKCKQHLICAHELLQIQEFLRPKEKDTLHKELLIKFSGEVFAGKYICRVCGQGIEDLDFDRNLEFDEEGRPLQGRGKVIDDDAVALDEEEEMLNGPGVLEEAVNYGTEERNTMAKAIQKVCGQLGVSPTDKDMKTMVNELNQGVKKIVSREKYIEQTKGQKVPDYDIMYALNYVGILASVVLVNIQTHIPDYVVYYTSSECSRGFFGFPLEEGEDMTGVECITTVCAGISVNEYPWNSTSLQKTNNLQKRKQVLLEFVTPQLEKYAALQNSQMLLSKKRKWRKDTFGSATSRFSSRDSLAESFRPLPYVLSEEEAAKEVVLPESATDAMASVAWIRQAHSVAKNSAPKKLESPHSDITCCLHNIRQPQEFWKDQRLPPLPKKAPPQAIFRTGFATCGFEAKKPDLLEGIVDSKDYYKLFARVCYQGDNKGLAHELGLTLTCRQCGITFETNPNLPLSFSSNEKKAKEEQAQAGAALKTLIENQGVEITEDSFRDLLSTARQKSILTMDLPPPVPRSGDFFTGLVGIEPHPFENWQPLMQRLEKAMDELGPSATQLQIATAAEDFITVVREKEEQVQRRLGAETYSRMESLLNRPTRQLASFLFSYLIVPLNRVLTSTHPNSFFILDSYKLHKGATKDIMEKGLLPHLRLVIENDSLTPFTKNKLKEYLASLRVFSMDVLPKLRAMLVPGHQTMVDYLLRAYMYGYTERFLNPGVLPRTEMLTLSEDDVLIERGGVDMKKLYEALAKSLLKFAQSSAVPSEEEILTNLERRAAAERELFAGELKKMPRDRRRVELEKKKLRMGKWAVGGDKSIREFDADRYEAERAERANAGFIDYVDRDTANEALATGLTFDLTGLDMADMGGEERIGGSGYHEGDAGIAQDED